MSANQQRPFRIYITANRIVRFVRRVNCILVDLIYDLHKGNIKSNEERVGKYEVSV